MESSGLSLWMHVLGKAHALSCSQSLNCLYLERQMQQSRAEPIRISCTGGRFDISCSGANKQVSGKLVWHPLLTCNTAAHSSRTSAQLAPPPAICSVSENAMPAGFKAHFTICSLTSVPAVDMKIKTCKSERCAPRGVLEAGYNALTPNLYNESGGMMEPHSLPRVQDMKPSPIVIRLNSSIKYSVCIMLSSEFAKLWMNWS